MLKLQQALNLINEVIKVEIRKDFEHKEQTKDTGTSFSLHYLKMARELLQEHEAKLRLGTH